MAQVSLPYTLQAGQPENVNQLVANLDALVTGVNTIDTAQLASGAVTQAKIADKTPAKPTYETSLPSSPADGQEIYYAANATDGVIWHLRYRSGSSSSYKWEFVGGSPLTAVDSDLRQITGAGSNAYAALPTDPLSLSLPSGIGGDFYVTVSASLIIATPGGVILPTAYLSYSTDAGGTNASDTWAASIGAPPGNGFLNTTYRHTNLAAATTFNERARVSDVALTGSFAQRGLTVLPIRVG